MHKQIKYAESEIFELHILALMLFAAHPTPNHEKPGPWPLVSAPLLPSLQARKPLFESFVQQLYYGVTVPFKTLRIFAALSAHCNGNSVYIFLFWE